MNEIRVLLVEDDEDDYILTRDLLSEINNKKFTLDWVESYDAAMERLSSYDYEICLFDYRLGMHSGLELLRDARAAGYTIPMILLTGQGDQEVDIEAMRGGAADYLIKGQIDASLLERSIRYALEQYRIEEERAQHIREQERREQAETANRAKDEFLAMVSHELRTPLNAIIGWTNILKIDKSNEKTIARAVEAIERSAKLQAQLIEDLLDVARIVNDNLRLEIQPVKLVSIIESVVDNARPSADAKNIKLEVDLNEGLNEEISGDPSRLQQIISNLLSNAVKFTSDGGHIKVKLVYTDENAQVTVSDTGRGIAADFLPHIFERYSQADHINTKRYEGLGLGLAIVSHLVKLHEGAIIAESGGENKGAVFTVRLPVSSKNKN